MTLLSTILAALNSAAIRYGIIAAAVAAVLGWGWLERTGRLHAEAQAAARAAELEQSAEALDAARADAARRVAALEAEAAAAAQRNTQVYAPIRRVIANAPPTNACAVSQPVRAVLDGLRQSRPGTSEQHPGLAIGLSATATAAR